MEAGISKERRTCKWPGCPKKLGVKKPYARYCDPHRAVARTKKKKWVATEFIDRKLERIYESPNKKTSPGVREFAKTIGWPKWALTKRARVLGLSRAVKEPPWSEPELRILQRFAWMCDARIQLNLKARGFHRTPTAIHLKLRRTAMKANLPYFSATSLAMCFGVDSHCITRWIRLRLLIAERRQTARTERHGDMWLIHENAVRSFIFKNPLEFDIRKVDQLWFMDIVTDGKIVRMAK